MNPNFKFISQLTALTLLTTCASAQQVNWAPLQMQTREWHKMVYDSDRQVVVMFGGTVPGSAPDWRFGNSETWEWDGDSWLRKSTIGPSPRCGHVMVYDSVRHVTLLIGSAYLGYTNDMWTWDGSSWTKLAALAPASDFYYNMFGGSDPSFGVFDSARGEVVFLNRESDSSIQGTWIWNGQSWRRAASNPNVWASDMAYDAARNRTVLYSASHPNNTQTWEWDGNRWEQRNVSSSNVLGFSSMTFDADQGAIVRHGGYVGSDSNGTICSSETWMWNGTEWIATNEEGSPPRTNHAIACLAARHQMVLFGGSLRNTFQQDSGANTDTFIRTGNRWTPVAQVHPSSREGAAMVYDPNRHVAVLFGGNPRNNLSAPNGETWEWDGLTWTQRIVSGPAPRSFHKMVYDTRRRKTVLIGGRSEPGRDLGDTWEWDGIQWERTSIDGPTDEGVGAAYDSDRDVVIAQTCWPLLRTWIRTHSSWSQLSVETPAVSGAGMTYDENRHVAVLFGGLSNGQWSRDTWEWNGTSWRRVATTGPTGRWHPAMTYDSTRRVVVMTAGNSRDWVVDDGVWEWDGSAWSERRTFGPETNPNYGPCPAMTYDNDHQRCVLLGSTYPEIWALGDVDCLRPSAWIVGSRFTCVEGSFDLYVRAAILQRQVQYQWRLNGVPIDPQRNFTANTEHLQASARLSNLGDYDCVVSDFCSSAVSNVIRVTACHNGSLCSSYPFTLEEFLQAFFAGWSTADINHDDVIDMFDYLDYIQLRDQLCH